MIDRAINFRLALIDGVTPTAQTMTGSQKELANATDEARSAVDSQNISFVKQVVSVSAFGMGVSKLTRGVTELGLVGEGTAATLRKINTGVSMIVGTFQLFKGMAGIVKMITGAEAGLAGVRTYNSVLKNPAMLGLVAGAIGVGAGVAGYFIGSSQTNNTTNVTQTAEFSFGAADERSTARGTLAILGG